MRYCYYRLIPDGEKWFTNLDIWKNKEYHDLQGKYPVIFLSFANVKETSYDGAVKSICETISELYKSFRELAGNNKLLEADREYFKEVMTECAVQQAANSLNRLSRLLYEVYGEKAIILLDEYDTPMQEA